MNCWHGYGPRHCTWPYPYDPPLYGRPSTGYRRPRDWDEDNDDLEEYLSDLEAEVERITERIKALRRSHARSQGTTPDRGARSTQRNREGVDDD